MADVSTKYMGLELKNPVIVGSSSLTNSVENVKKCAASGVGAVVLKSLFEEQIYEEKVRSAQEGLPNSYHAEAMEYIRQMSMGLGPENYLKLIAACKSEVSIPIIASLNCVDEEWWTEYARRIEDAGADGLELNISFITRNPKSTSEDIEDRYISIVKKVRKAVSIPIAVKLGPYFTSLSHMARRLADAGVDALVVFNRFYQIDIDIENLKLKSGYSFTDGSDMTVSLRWVSMLANRVECDVAGSRGVHTSEDVIKHLLAGANAVQVCSAFYQNGLDHLGVLVDGLRSWMDEKGFNSVEDFRGKLSQENSSDPETYERLQYIKAVVGIE